MEKRVERYDMINILRVVCAYLVIIVHLATFASVSQGLESIFSDFICRIAVPFFFITSGYFFYTNVNKEGYFQNYSKKLILIYIGITLTYLVALIPASIYLNFINKGVIYTIKAVLVNGVVESLWYFPALIISIVFVYFFIKRDLIKSLMIISIILFFIGLSGDSYLELIKNTQLIKIVNVYNFIFDSTRNGITFGVPFITIGALIKRYSINEKIKKPLMLLILFTVIYGVEVHYLLKSGSHDIYFSLALVSPIIFIMALKSKVSISNETSKCLKEMSLWIYAFHILLYELLSIFNFFGETSSVLMYLFVCGTMTIIAYIITRIRLKGIVINKTATRKILLYSGLILIISWALIKTPIDNTASATQDTSPTTDFTSIENKESTNVTGPMWKISDEDSSIYLYSCFTLIEDVYAEDETMFPLSPTFDNALKDSDEVILYTKRHGYDQKSNAKMYFYANNCDTIDKHITKEAYSFLMDKAKEVREKNPDEKTNFDEYFTDCKGAQAYNDICTYLALDQIKFEFENQKYTTDQYIRYKANNLNKKVQYMFGTNEITVGVCSNEDNDVNNAYAMLTKYINKDYINNMKKSFEYWKQGDNDKAVQEFNTFTFENEEDKKNFAKYKKIVQDAYNKDFQPFRNKAIDSISTYLKDNKKCFVSLDFKMLSGENNILKDLQDKGYKVEKVGA